MGRHPEIDLNLHGDGAWPDLAPGTYKDGGFRIGVVRLRGGMASGKDSLAIRLESPDGDVMVAQTSVAAWLVVADALRAAEEGERARGER
jgi:hypothetical protein